METVQVDGVEIAYERAGSGPALVFVHSAASDSRIWGPQIAALAGDFTVVAWDEPGAGRSSDVPPEFTLADYAACLAALMEALELGPAHVAGSSWGGTLALELYRRRPDLVATLVLAGTYAGWKGSLPAAEVRARVEGMRTMLAVGEERFDPALPGLFAGDPPAEFVSLLEAMAADVRPESMRTAVPLMAEADERDLMPTISVPTLLIWGEDDGRSPLYVARQFEEAIPDAQLVVIPGAGHVANLEQPEAFNDAVRGFCRAHQRSLENVERVRGAFEAFLRRDLGAGGDILHPDIVWDASDSSIFDISGVYHGLDGVAEFWREWLSAWETVEFEYELIDAGDRVVALINQHMRARSTHIDVPIGKYAQLYTFRDGLVVHWKLYESQSEALEAVGLPAQGRSET
jgi:pimeloyl-ACP methyl ester carboxylesterase/ketosteroid isomerase-like protein